MFVAAVAAVIALDAAFGLGARLADDATWVALRDVLEDNAAAAVVVFCLATVVGCVVLALPGAVFAVVAALLFGPFWGTVWCVASAWAGAVAAFRGSLFSARRRARARGEKRSAAPLAFLGLVAKRGGHVGGDAFGPAVSVQRAELRLRRDRHEPCDVRGVHVRVHDSGTALYAYGAAGLLDAGNRAVYLGVAVVLAAALIVIGVVLKRRYLDA